MKGDAVMKVAIESVEPENSGDEHAESKNSGTENTETGPEAAEAERTEPEDVEAERTAPEDVEAEQTAPEDVEAERTGPEDVEAERTGPEDVEAERTGPEDVEAEQTGHEAAETEQTGHEAGWAEQAGPESTLDLATARAIEAVLMVSDQPVAPDQLAGVTGVSVDAVEAVCSELQAQYLKQRRGFVLQKVAGGYRFQSHPDQAVTVERFVLDGQVARLSAAALETLAIVAYKQPISRNQISAIRGVNAEGVVRTLEARGYVSEVGQDPGPGRATLYGTTSTFLERLGINDVTELPDLGQFVPDADVVEALESTLFVGSAVTGALAEDVGSSTGSGWAGQSQDLTPGVSDDVAEDAVAEHRAGQPDLSNTSDSEE